MKRIVDEQDHIERRDLTNNGFWGLHMLNVVSYKILLALNNRYLDGSPECRHMIAVVDDFIKSGLVEKNNAVFLFKSKYGDDLYYINHVRLDSFDLEKSQRMYGCLSHLDAWFPKTVKTLSGEGVLYSITVTNILRT